MKRMADDKSLSVSSSLLQQKQKGKSEQLRICVQREQLSRSFIVVTLMSVIPWSTRQASAALLPAVYMLHMYSVPYGYCTPMFTAQATCENSSIVIFLLFVPRIMIIIYLLYVTQNDF